MRRGLLAAVAIAAIWSATANGATFNVTTTVDTDDGTCNVANCTLREAVNAASSNAGPDAINVPAGTYELFAGSLVVSGANANGTTISGAGARSTILSGRDVSRVLHNSALTLSVSGLRVRDGFATDEGGGILNYGGMALNNVTVMANQAGTDMQAGNGGGILVDFGGTLTLMNSTVSGNTAAGGGQGGGLYQSAQLGDPDGNGVLTGSIVTIANTTFSGNSAGSGGAVATGISGTSFSESTLALTAATLHANSASTASAVFRSTAAAEPVTITMTRTIVSGTCVGAIANGGSNLDANSSCGFGNSLPLNLEPLANNGGPTDTHALGDGSAALNTAGACTGPDQRGATRPFGGACDVGAYEAGPANLAVAIADSPDPVGMSAALTYTVTVTNPGESAVEGGQAFVALPSSVTPVSASAPSGTGCTLAAIVVCTFGRLGRGSIVTITVVVISPAATGVITADATVTGLGTDSDPTNNAASTATNVVFVPPPVALDTTAPSGSLSFKAAYALARTLTRGLTGSVIANEAATIRATATVSKKIARRYKLKKTTVASGSAALGAAGTAPLKLRFTREARRKLARAASFVVTIKVGLVDAAGNETTLAKQTKLRR